MKLASGFTLIECLITLIIVILTSLFLVPAVRDFLLSQQGKQAIASLQLHVNSARTQAILLQQPVTMCPSHNGVVCSNNWNDAIIIFTDHNRNGRIDKDTFIIRTIAPAKSGEWRAFNGSIIHFTAQGFSGFNTGSLSYCSDNTARVTSVFIISRVGRIRLEKNNNSGKVAKLANGKNVPCSPH